MPAVRRRAGWARIVLSIVVVGLWCSATVPRGHAATFDCGLSADRIASLTTEMGKDVSDYQSLQPEIAGAAGRFAAPRDQAETAQKKNVVAFIRKTVPGKLTALMKEVRQARARDCLTEGKADEIAARGAALADAVRDGTP